MKVFCAVIFFILFTVSLAQANSLSFAQHLEKTPVHTMVNPAGNLNEDNRFQVQLVYENRFLLSDLSLKTIAVGKALKQHVWNLIYNEWGSKYYKQRLFFLNYSTQLFDNFRVGININFNTTHQQNLSKPQLNLFSALGLACQIDENNKLFSSFLYSRMLNGSRMNLEFFYQKKLQTQLSIQGGITGDTLLSSGQLSTSNYSIQLALLLDFTAKNRIVLGFNSGPHPVFFSYRHQWKNLCLNLSVWYHTQLNTSQQLSINYTIE